MTPRRVLGSPVLNVAYLAGPGLELARAEATAVERRAAAIAQTSAVGFETARDELAAYLAAGVDLDLAERAIRDGLPSATAIDALQQMEVQTVKERERPAPTVEDIKAWAEASAAFEDRGGGKWRGRGHAGQAEKAKTKRRRRAKLARASRRRR